MISLSLLLHLHQPPTQFPEVLRLVFRQSYQPLLEFLSENKQAHLTLNITASLMEQLDNLGMSVWLEKLRGLVEEGRVELTGTAAYHALLPRIPEEEVRRQILLEESALSGLRSSGLCPPALRGFFPPEMGVDERTLRLIEGSGYSWVAVDETAVSGRLNLPQNGLFAWEGSTFKKRNLTLKLVVRNKELSLRLAFGAVKTLRELLSYTNNHKPITNNFIVALDGETFGHHHPELLPFLGELLAHSGRGGYKLVTVSEMISENLPASQAKRWQAGQPSESVGIRSSTWSDGFGRWADPNNPIHQKQWRLTELALKAVNESKYAPRDLGSRIDDVGLAESSNPKSYLLNPTSAQLKRMSSEHRKWWKARGLLDRALHSDQYWWASAHPNWHYKMVERGARLLRDTVSAVPDASTLHPKDDRPLAEDANSLYSDITHLGLEKYGDTVVV